MKLGTLAPIARDNGKMPHPHPDSFIELNYATTATKRKKTGPLIVAVITNSFPRALHELIATHRDNVKCYHASSRMLATENFEYYFFTEPHRMDGHQFDAWGKYVVGDPSKSDSWWNEMEANARARTR